MNNSAEWIGKKFERLTVISFEHAKPPYRGWLWVCECECGNIKTLIPNDIKQGKVRSCGCLHNEMSTERATKFKHLTKNNKRLYSIYNGVKKRCYNKAESRYKDYGARGIKMCEEWLVSFDNFVEWSLSNGYSNEMTLERVDVNGDYSPYNCKWITLEEQAFNKRDTKWVTYKGESIQLVKLCKRENVSYDTVHNRIYSLGWSVERAIDEPSQQENSLRNKCRERGINYETVRSRILKFGWSEEKALNTPPKPRKHNI